MNPYTAIQSQYLAALEMLKQVIVKCPEALRDAPGIQDKLWRKSYSGTFNNTQVNCMNAWEHTKTSNWTGFYPAALKEYE